MKIPMLRPVVEAVTFGFERIGMMIRIAWLPILVVILLHISAIALMGAGAAGLSSLSVDVEDTEEAAAAAGAVLAAAGGPLMILVFFALSILSGLIFSMVLVAATRASTLAAYEPPGLPFYFQLGPREVRYFAASLIYGALCFLLAIVFGGLAVGAVALTVSAAEAIAGSSAAFAIAGVGGAGALAIALTGVWIGLRFITVLPIAAVDNRIDFPAAWRMTKGNFWRLLVSGALFVSILQAATGVVFLALLLPVAVVFGVIGLLLSGLVGGAGLAAAALGLIALIPISIVVGSFALGAHAAYTARLYAYLTDCGDDCDIFRRA